MNFSPKQYYRWQTWYYLMRIDKPIGMLLLMWPTLWALWIASMAIPELKIMTVFILGVFCMRAAGCVINDYIDRNIDGLVQRTSNRPLLGGTINKTEVKLLFIILIGISFALVSTLNNMTIILSTIALALVLVYPFMKRYTHLPQLVLGIAFSWSIPMVFTAVNESLPLHCWLLFIANIIWTISYDTQYAMVDRDDDLLIGIKSTAILFGRFDRIIIGLLQLIVLILLNIVGWQLEFNKIYYISLIVVAMLFLWQQKLIFNRDRRSCLKAFSNNNFVGMTIFVGIALSVMSR